MADDRHYVPGDNYLLDDLSGFKIRSSRARIIPGGITGNLAVAPRRWEDQQPQDFVTGVQDDQTADLVRSRQKNQFIITGTYVVAPTARGGTIITVDSTDGFVAGNVVLVMLDSGENFQTGIAAVGTDTLTLASILPASVGTLYGDPIENSVLLLQGVTLPVVFVLGIPGRDILGFNVLG